MRRWLFIVLLSVFSLSAFAVIPATSGYVWGARDGYNVSTAQAACSLWLNGRTQYALNIVDENSALCYASPYDGYSIFRTASLICPANSVLSGSNCVCDAGTVEQGGQCVDPNAACTPKMGQSTIVNFTVGYARTPDANDFDVVGTPNQLPASGNLCYQGCNVAASYGGPGVSAFRSQTPTAQGLYRLSLDLPALQLGTACTADGGSSAPLRPDLPSPTCPGFVGEVNGKPGCYGTANSPVNVVPSDRPPVAPVAGNPAAGEKPASGEGSGTGSAGRTPTTGNGGNAGGPASAAVGGAGGGAGGTAASGAGTKPTEDGKEQVACGAPGQPKCGIDETGTPKGKEDTAVADAQKTIKPLDDFVKNPTSFLPTFPTINWAFTLPTGCSPIALTAFDPWLQSIDICTWLPMFHDLMSFIWVMGGIFGAIGTFWRNTFSQG